MPYTNNPQFNTYKTETLKFDGEDLYRSGDLSTQRDLQIINMYYDTVSQANQVKDRKLKKRDGLTATTYSLSKNSASDVLRGSFYDVDQNAFHWAVNSKVYSVTPDVGTSVRTVATLVTSSGHVGFCSYLKSDNTRYVCISDGTDLWIDDYAATSCSKVTDADMPTPHQPYPLYIDGYLLLIKANTSDMYNSDADDPTSWTSDNFISAEISSDWALCLYKVKNYIISLGYNSIEYFYDAGNETGSPFGRNDSPVRGVGYITGGCQIGDTVFFVGQDDKQNIAVYTINSFKVERISNPVVDRTIQTFSSTQNSKSNTNLATNGFVVSTNGHTFYVLVTTQTTWAYDIYDHVWYEWKGSTGVGLKLEASWAMYNGAQYMAIGDQTTISMMTPSKYQDFGSNFTCRYTTENADFDTFNWKVAHRVALMCSQYMPTGTSHVNISWSDDDWNTSTTPRNINVFTNSPYISQCGKFRNRSFRIEYTDNYPFFMSGLRLDLNVYGI